VSLNWLSITNALIGMFGNAPAPLPLAFAQWDPPSVDL
jgi:hypothetical protein